MNEKAFKEIIEQPISELRLSIERHQEDPFLSTYAKAIFCFLKGDIDGLKEAQKIRVLIKNPEEKRFLSRALDFRLKIREQNLVLADIDSWSDQYVCDLLKGEITFLKAMAYEKIGEKEKSKSAYFHAHEYLKEGGADKKSAKALLNYVSIMTQIQPDSAYIGDYLNVYSTAKKAKDLITCGMALTNLAREYQKAGAMVFASKYSEKALVCLAQDTGSLHHSLALLNHGHILLELRRVSEACDIVVTLTGSPFAEIQQALEVLRELCERTPSEESRYQRLTPSWLERLRGPRIGDGSAAPELQSKAIRFLLGKPRDKFELMSELYGDMLDIEVKENRLKNLLQQIKKRHPNRVHYSEGHYFIDEKY